MGAACYFVTATDTDAGKTFVSCALLAHAQRNKLSTLALKPIAAGLADGLDENGDAVALADAASQKPARRTVNPWLFRAAIAPHIAARLEGATLDAAAVARHCDAAIRDYPADICLIEGAGGWLVPLNDTQTFADFVVELARLRTVGVVLVIPLQLGCLNHALLSAQAIRAAGLTLAGWVGNTPNPVLMARRTENVETLRHRLKAPCLGILPHAASPAEGAVQQELLPPWAPGSG